MVGDPIEAHLLWSEPLAAALNNWMAATGQLLRFDEDLAAAQAREDELRALGYLE